MPEDLTTAENEQEQQQYEQGAEEDFPSPHDDIAAAYNAVLAIDGIDGTLIGRVRKIKAIQRMSVDIIYEQMKYIADCILPPRDKEEEED